VVDDSNRRRGFLYQCTGKIKLPFWLVIIYCLKDCCSIDHGDFDLLCTISVAVREMSERVTQIEKARRLDITEDVYYEIIQRKRPLHLLLLVRRG
jgi:octaprenyl-diphosphate synthase